MNSTDTIREIGTAYKDNYRIRVLNIENIKDMSIFSGDSTDCVMIAEDGSLIDIYGKPIIINEKDYHPKNSESRKIYEFDLGTKVKKYIGDGHNPIISRKGNVMGYMIRDDNLKRKNFFVKNLNTGEIWKKKYDAYSYVLSPDENFVLMRKEGRGFGFFCALPK